MRPVDALDWMIAYDMDNPKKRDQEWAVKYWRVDEVRQAIIQGRIQITEELMQRIRFSSSLHKFVIESICLKQLGAKHGTDT